MEFILGWLSHNILALIQYAGYLGIGILMALESANFPIPSEIAVPFSGFLVWRGVFTFWGVVLSATVGNLVGSVISYEIGAWGGRPFLQRYGKFFLIQEHDLNLADRLFQRFGSPIIFVGRLLPIVRTFISLPAGIAHMPRKTFFLYTLLGSIPWNAALAYIGFKAGENWHMFEGYFRAFDWLIGGIIVIVGGWWIWRHIRIKAHKV